MIGEAATTEEIEQWIASLSDQELAELDNLLSGYEVFKVVYKSDPAGFMQDCIDWQDEEPAFYQLEIASNLIKYRRECVRSLHGAGKTTTAALLILWFCLTRDGDTDWKIAATASVFRQLSKYLAPEVHKWARRIKWDRVGREPFTSDELLSLEIKLSTGQFFCLTSNDPGNLEGLHADSLLFIFDESKLVPDEVWDALEGAFSTHSDVAGKEIFVLAISTPGSKFGRFYDIQSRKKGYEDWHTTKIGLAEAVKARRVSKEWAEQRKAQWGEDSPVYIARVLADFSDSGTEGVIPLSWIERAVEYHKELIESGQLEELTTHESFTSLGLDVGAGGDASTFAPRYGYIIKELRYDNQKDTMAVTGKAKGILDANNAKNKPVTVDVIGIGLGVADRLEEQKYYVVRFNAANKTDFRDESNEFGFVNIRSASWWNLRQLLNPLNDFRVALPDDDRLIGDLASPTYKIRSGAVIFVESKDEIRKRLRRSTDAGDSVVMAFWEDVNESWFVKEYRKKHGR